jgi:Restriction endonuclease
VARRSPLAFGDNKMSPNWHDYQDRIAAFFRSLGLQADTDVNVQGVRATHKIDVCVRFERFGIPTTWVAECKLWRTRVPKEKVLVLHSIVQDIGADKAFLLSESGFQAGAISSARSTNIILTDLHTLEQIAAEEMDAIRWQRAQDQLEKSLDRLHSIPWEEQHWKTARLYQGIEHAPPGYYTLLAKLATFEYQIPRGKKGKLPLTIKRLENDVPIHTEDIDEFFKHLNHALEEGEQYFAQFKG